MVVQSADRSTDGDIDRRVKLIQTTVTINVIQKSWPRRLVICVEPGQAELTAVKDGVGVIHDPGVDTEMLLRRKFPGHGIILGQAERSAVLTHDAAAHGRVPRTQETDLGAIIR